MHRGNQPIIYQVMRSGQNGATEHLRWPFDLTNRADVDGIHNKICTIVMQFAR